MGLSGRVFGSVTAQLVMSASVPFTVVQLRSSLLKIHLSIKRDRRITFIKLSSSAHAEGNLMRSDEISQWPSGLVC